MSAAAARKAPKVGDIFDDLYDGGYAWLVEAIGASGIVYVCVLKDGERTQSFLEWPLSRWSWVLERQRARGAA